MAPALMLIAIALPGCNDILDDQASQPGLIGNVTITTKRCFFGAKSASPPYTCDPASGILGDSTLQGLIAYQVPAGVEEPSSFNGVSDAPGDVRTSTYTFSQSYTDALEATSPAPPGEKWRGYISEVETYTLAQSVPQVETIAATFRMPPAPGGGPARGPFQWLTIVGSRYVNDTDLPASRPVGGCGVTLHGGYVTPGQTLFDTHCMDYPDTLPSLSSLPTSDFAIKAPAPGASLDVPFGWQLAGPAVGAPFALAAQTDIPGASAVPADPSLSPGADSNGTELVHVSAPASTPGGDYHVMLVATLPGGQTRSATALVHLAPPAQGPAPAQQPLVTTDGATGPGLTLARVRRQRLRSALAHGLILDLGCAEPCRLDVSLGRLRVSASKPARIGGRRLALRNARHVRVRVPFTRQARKRLRRVRRLVLGVRVVGVDAAGRRSVATRRVTLR